jgi:formylmethanofuran dehydrogenase subunit A
MLTRIKGGRVIDPANGRDGIGEVWIRDGRVVAAPDHNAAADTVHDAAGKIVMAGAIDIHSHIAGSHVNTARLLRPEADVAAQGRSEMAPAPSTFLTGCRYAEMGFTMVVEPAVAPTYALHAHLELADIPIIDKATLAVLGNDDVLLDLLYRRESPDAIRDYVAFTFASSRALGIKVINAGGSLALKHNVRQFGLDDIVPFYGASSRAIVKALQHAVHDLGVPHPLHVHCNNLGMAGNAETALATIAAAEGLPLHLAHLQFYAYGSEGPRGFSSAAPKLAEAVNGAKNVTIDVGQVMFGQTVTVSSDLLRQFNGRHGGKPRKWVIEDGDANGGGVVPYRYRAGDFYNAVQWAAGLELFLLIDNPAQVFFTTDHPNGAPFTAYPDLFALLMSREKREQCLKTLPPDAVAMTTLPSIKREYSFSELAVMTRAAPAKLLGLPDRGHLGPGARGDVAIYDDDADRAKMFRNAHLVLKDGKPVVRDGAVIDTPSGRAMHVAAEPDGAMQRRMRDYCETRYGTTADVLAVPVDAIGRAQPFEQVPCGR